LDWELSSLHSYTHRKNTRGNITTAGFELEIAMLESSKQINCHLSDTVKKNFEEWGRQNMQHACRR
jgi:hypothetical protein